MAGGVGPGSPGALPRDSASSAVTGANTNLAGYQEGWELGVKEAERAVAPMGMGLSLMAALQVHPTPGWPKASLTAAIPHHTVRPALALPWKALDKWYITATAGVRLNAAESPTEHTFVQRLSSSQTMPGSSLGGTARPLQ